MGRKPLPTSIKRKKGTAQNTRILEDEYTPDLLEKLPPPPDHLNEYAIIEYQKVGKQLLDDGLIVNIDMASFIAYCVEMGNYIEAQKVLNNDGRVIKNEKSGYMQPHPMVAISNTSLKNAMSIGVQFGITPSARTKVAGPKKENRNPIGKLIALNGKGKKTA